MRRKGSGRGEVREGYAEELGTGEWEWHCCICNAAFREIERLSLSKGEEEEEEGEERE